MSMIHYKFKGTNTWDRLSSDNGPFSVLELKREIIKHKRLGNADFDLVITDAQSGANYIQDGYLIPRNAAVIVRRVPTTKQKALLLRAVDEVAAGAPAGASAAGGEGGGEDGGGGNNSNSNSNGNGEEVVDEFGEAIYAESKEEDEAVSKEQEEEAKMLSVLNKAAQYKSFGNRSTTFGVPTNEGAGGMDEFRRKMPKVGGRNEFGGGGGGGDRSNRVPPSHYICNRCNKPGHFIRSCPTNGDSEYDSKRPKHATGIPRSFLKPIAAEEAERELDAAEEEEKERSGGTVMLEAEKDGQKVPEFYVARPNNYEFQKFYGKDGQQQQRGNRKRSQAGSAVAAALSSSSTASSSGGGPDAFLLCRLCSGLYRDAVAVSCCYSSFCDECIRQELVSTMSCPMCGFGVSVEEELLVNRGVRKLVDDYVRQHHGQQQQQQSATAADTLTANGSNNGVEGFYGNNNNNSSSFSAAHAGGGTSSHHNPSHTFHVGSNNKHFSRSFVSA